MDLIIASNNAHKIIEIKAILAPYFTNIKSLREAGIEHETIEDGTTFMENAIKKAREIAEISGCCALSDDSGICIDALGGAPGVYSARYSGEHGNDKLNNALVLKNLGDTENRGAHYTAAIALVYPNGEVITAEGYCYGKIGFEEIGEGGFGYDPLFFLEEYNCTMAQITAEQKNAISHRHNALIELVEKINGRI